MATSETTFGQRLIKRIDVLSDMSSGTAAISDIADLFSMSYRLIRKIKVPINPNLLSYLKECNTYAKHTSSFLEVFGIFYRVSVFIKTFAKVNANTTKTTIAKFAQKTIKLLNTSFSIYRMTATPILKILGRSISPIVSLFITLFNLSSSSIDFFIYLNKAKNSSGYKSKAFTEKIVLGKKIKQKTKEVFIAAVISLALTSFYLIGMAISFVNGSIVLYLTVNIASTGLDLISQYYKKMSYRELI